MNSKRCVSCGSNASARVYFGTMIIVAFALMASVSIAVAVLKAEGLANFVTVVLLFQQFISVGKSSTAALPSSLLPLAEFFNAVSIINFDLEFFRPGCTGPPTTFIELFWFTILLWVGTGIMFFVACLIRRALRVRLERPSPVREAYAERSVNTSIGPAASVTPPNVDFRRRLLHSFLVLLAFFYLKITTLCIRSLLCSVQPDPTSLVTGEPSATSSLYLTIDPNVQCYSKYHAVTVVFSFILLLVYSAGKCFSCFKMRFIFV